MTKNEFLQSELYIGKIIFVDTKTNAMWSEELLSVNSKKAKALMAKFPKGGCFSKTFMVKFVIKGGSEEFDLGID